MEWESDSPCCSHTYPGQECQSPGRRSCWELEFRDWGAIPEQALLLIAERGIEGMWGRRSWWEMLVEESQAAMEARGYCWVMHRGWSHYHSLSLPTHTSIQSWTIESLAHETPDALNYRVGPHPGCSFKRLMHQTSKKDSRQGSPLNAWTGGATERERLAKGAFWSPATRNSEKDSDRA